MDNNKILFALLEQLLSKSEDGECEALEKLGEDKEPDVEEMDIEEPSAEDEGDEDSEKMKKFLAALKG
jgi:CheY-like chemotaxis protein